MEIINKFVFKKEVDWSMLKEGMTIPSYLNDWVKAQFPLIKDHGCRQNIKVVFYNKEYIVKLSNLNFDQKKYPNRLDILQIRYSPNSDFVQALRTIFFRSFQYIENKRAHGKHLAIPKELKEYLVLYPTVFPDMLIAEYLTNDEISSETDFIREQDEQIIEEIMNIDQIDPTSTIITKICNQKIRKYNRTIGENLKRLYDNKCQICGQEFKGRYDIDLSEIHHIEYYSKSLNNNSDNLLVLCPNHHRIIHKANLRFDTTKLRFYYSNGIEDNIKTNNHLIIG